MLGTTNSALNRVLVEIPEDLIQIGAQVKNMQAMCRCGYKFNPLANSAEIHVDRTHLHILPLLVFQGSLQIAKQKVTVLDGIAKGLAMVGKRERHQAISGEAAFDAAEDQSVAQDSGWWRSCEGHRFITVGAAKGPQPTDRMKHRRIWVSCHKLGPPRVLRRIDLIKSHRRCPTLLHNLGWPVLLRGRMPVQSRG